ncbi:unnamed protein product [Protopolystoma xenopodis]|uniref:ENTH domain-containing protein n=1 Tax=Protopolystoma xenopodis TaxID=117903 RepID=A0A448WHI6_9PLAT|nr:unnamed protein product [Protopolystoma xenopodis]
MKNTVKNYSDCQRLVREATSNDPWGPSSSSMLEIAVATQSPIHYEEIMSLLWSRLQDKTKYWRHILKSLIVMEYIMKVGNQAVSFV